MFLEAGPQETQVMDVGDRQDADRRETHGFLLLLPHVSDTVIGQAQIIRLGRRHSLPLSHLTRLCAWLEWKVFTFPACNDH